MPSDARYLVAAAGDSARRANREIVHSRATERVNSLDNIIRTLSCFTRSMETYKIITARYDSHARAVEMTDRHREEEREREWESARERG